MSRGLAEPLQTLCSVSPLSLFELAERNVTTQQSHGQEHRI